MGASAAASIGLLACKTGNAMPVREQTVAKERNNNINHSVCRWCYNSIPMEEFLKNLMKHCRAKDGEEFEKTSEYS